MKYIRRHMETCICNAGQTFKALLVTGARQVGKSTFIINQLLYNAVNYNGSVSFYVAPTNNQSRKVFREIVKLMEEHPKALVLAHPECKGPVLALADVVGSTAVLLKYAIEHPENDYIVATESGILHEMQRNCPETLFYAVPPEVSEGTIGCHCNECDYMKMNTLLKIYNALKYEWPTVEVDPEIAVDAVKPIERMLELS